MYPFNAAAKAHARHHPEVGDAWRINSQEIAWIDYADSLALGVRIIDGSGKEVSRFGINYRSAFATWLDSKGSPDLVGRGVQVRPTLPAHAIVNCPLIERCAECGANAEQACNPRVRRHLRSCAQETCVLKSPPAASASEPSFWSAADLDAGQDAYYAVTSPSTPDLPERCIRAIMNCAALLLHKRAPVPGAQLRLALALDARHTALLDLLLPYAKGEEGNGDVVGRVKRLLAESENLAQRLLSSEESHRRCIDVLDGREAQLSSAVADNAALLESLQAVRATVPAAHWNPLSVDALLSGPHPGAALLERHRKEAQKAQSQSLEAIALAMPSALGATATVTLEDGAVVLLCDYVAGLIRSLKIGEQP